MADGAATPVDAGKTADRSLDSALDFLQDGEAEAEEEEEEEDEFEMFDIFDDSPDLEINYDLISELGKKDLEFLANKGVPAAVAQQAVVDAAIKKWQKHDNDVGSAEVQVAIAHHRIKYLTAHLIENKKDVATKRGLQALVVQRKKFLGYLYKTNPEKAEAMVSELGIRFRGNVASWDKNSKYGAYKNTKSKWEKIRAEKRMDAAARKKKTLGISV
jgi:small subunit ribosomal protein S15